MSVKIRRARASDAHAILDLEKHFPSDRMSLRSVRDFLRSKSARVLVAAAPEVLAALVLLLRKGSRAGRIYSIVVGEAGRGRGLAKRLVGSAERLARADGREHMTLEVREENVAARALYAGLGYAESGRLPNYYDDGADGVRLTKPLRRSRIAL